MFKVTRPHAPILCETWYQLQLSVKTYSHAFEELSGRKGLISHLSDISVSSPLSLFTQKQQFVKLGV